MFTIKLCHITLNLLTANAVEVPLHSLPDAEPIWSLPSMTLQTWPQLQVWQFSCGCMTTVLPHRPRIGLRHSSWYQTIAKTSKHPSKALRQIKRTWRHPTSHVGKIVRVGWSLPMFLYFFYVCNTDLCFQKPEKDFRSLPLWFYNSRL